MLGAETKENDTNKYVDTSRKPPRSAMPRMRMANLDKSQPDLAREAEGAMPVMPRDSSHGNLNPGCMFSGRRNSKH